MDGRKTKFVTLAGIRTFGLFLILLSFSVPLSFGQNSPKGELFVGFSALSNGDPILKGWNASAALHINKQLAIVTDFSGHYVSQSTTQGVYSFANFLQGTTSASQPTLPNSSSETDIHTFLAGPQFSHHITGRARIFARALFGASRVHVRNSIKVGVLTTTPQLRTPDFWYDPLAFCLYCQRADAQWGFSFGAGGGLDVTVARHWAVRVLQADYLNKPNVLGQGSNDFRLSSGLLYQW